MEPRINQAIYDIVTYFYEPMAKEYGIDEETEVITLDKANFPGFEFRYRLYHGQWKEEIHGHWTNWSAMTITGEIVEQRAYYDKPHNILFLRVDRKGNWQ